MARDLQLTVLGTGYLGVAHAACLADAGFRVLGVGTDMWLVAHLKAGNVAIHEPGLAGMLRGGLASERLAFTTSYQEAAAFGDVHFLCAGTPQRPDGSADLSQVRACPGRLAPLLARPCLVVGKSVARRAVADCRHALDAERWRAAGWRYGALGTPLSHMTGATARASL